MKFICDRRELCKAIASLSKAIVKNPILKVLEGVRIYVDSFYSKQVVLSGYNMELGIQAKVPAITEGNGDSVVSYQLLSKVLKKMTGNEVTIDISEKSAVVQCGSTEFSIPAMTVEDYPTLPSFEEGETFSIEQGKLRSMIQQTRRLLLRLEQLHDQLCPDYEPDWSNISEKKFCLAYLYPENFWFVNDLHDTKYPIAYFDTEENAEKALKILNEEIKNYE